MEQSEENVLVCPICQHRNELDAKRCAQCGVTLTGNTTTMRVTDEQVERAMGDLEISPPVLREGIGDGLVFYIAGEVQPIIVSGKDQIVLGRQVEGQPAPDVLDMTAYHGHLLGVSRRHARVTVGAEECLLEDLNSTNGTWLNEKRLTPNTPYILSNGDQIRLGQCILFVYFSAPSPSQNVIIKRSASAAAVLPVPSTLTLDLAEETLGYLRALVTLQAAVDSIHLRAGEQRGVAHLEIDGAEASVEAALSGLSDAVSITQQVIVPWQKRSFSLLVPLWKGELSPEVLEVKAAPDADAAPVAPEASPEAAPPAAAQEAASAVAASHVTPPNLADLVNGEVTEEIPPDLAADLLGRSITGELRAARIASGAAGEPDLAFAQQLLVENVLRQVKSEPYALDAPDDTIRELLRPPVLALSCSTLEIVRSSY
jgi:pSer/pThr/pTyr-binding forkhead associated (FHA) protein